MNPNEEKIINQKKLKRVMVATPCYDGKVSVEYMHSLIPTIFKGIELGYDIFPVNLCNESLLCTARDDLFSIAIAAKVDELVFIDSDNTWIAEDFFKLLSHNVDIVTGCSPKKSDIESYNVRIKDGENKLLLEKNGLIEVKGAGFAFFRISGMVLEHIYKAGTSYISQGKEKRMLFQRTIDSKTNEITSEDLSFCNLCRSIGLKIYLDPTIVCNHIGQKRYTGNFIQWLRVNGLLEFV